MHALSPFELEPCVHTWRWMLLLAKFYLQTNKLLFAERVSGSFFVLFRQWFKTFSSVRQSLPQLQQAMEVDAEHVVETKEVPKEDKEKKEEEVDPTEKVYVGFTLEKIPVRHPVSTKSAPVDRQLIFLHSLPTR